MKTVFFLPGFAGVSLTRISNQERFWVNRYELAVNGLYPMNLAADGNAPAGLFKDRPNTSGVSLIPSYADKLDDEATKFYKPIIKPLSNVPGHQLVMLTYDWRKNILKAAQKLKNYVLDLAAADNPCTLVGHSAGGVICRYAWLLLKATNDHDRVRRIITLCAPHRGTYEAIRLFDGTADNISQIIKDRQGFENAVGIVPMSAQDGQEIFASWPAVYQLMPFLYPGFLDVDPDRELLFRANKWDIDISQEHANYAITTHQIQTMLPDSFPPWEVMTTVAGTGERTPYALDGKPPFGLKPTPLKYHTRGDRLVEEDSALIDNSKKYTVNGTHQGAVNSQFVLDNIIKWVLDERTAPQPMPNARIEDPTPAVPDNFFPPLGFGGVDQPGGSYNAGGDP